MSGGSDGIEVHYHTQLGQVTLTCGDEAFDRLWGLVADVAGPIEGAHASVRVVLIQRTPKAPLPFRWWHSLGLLGCAVVGFVLLFVLVTGVRTIAGWLR